eukprot:COSAG04_NODE_6865_length_1238_cov_9.361257_1_plen_22_part_10
MIVEATGTAPALAPSGTRALVT